MAYRFEGVGCMKEFTFEMDRLLELTDNSKVIQAQSMSGVASMNIQWNKWELIIGE